MPMYEYHCRDCHKEFSIVESIHEHETVEEASSALLSYILVPMNWVSMEQLREQPGERPGQNAAYQRRVGKLRICASVDITGGLDVFLRVSFNAAGLTPMKAADHLEAFLKGRVPFMPNAEWAVEVDERSRWIHFTRKYAGPPLKA